jgi:hypothetical protein
MAAIRLDTTDSLALEVSQYVTTLARAAGVTSGSSGVGVQGGYKGQVSVDSGNKNPRAAAFIMDEVQKKFGDRLAKTTGRGTSAIADHDYYEAARFRPR